MFRKASDSSTRSVGIIGRITRSRAARVNTNTPGTKVKIIVVRNVILKELTRKI